MASALAALARVRRDQGRTAEVVQLLGRAVTLEEAAHGLDHPEVTKLKAELQGRGG